MSDPNRQPKGISVGGQYATKTHTEVDISLSEPEAEAPADAPPLKDYRVVGFVRKTSSPTPGVNLPGSTCWHCGAGIINCVQARHIETDETIDVGMDCAERTGLDKAALKKMLREKFAEERATRRRRQTAAERAREEAEEAEAVRRFGEHGTESRYSDGNCRCVGCRSVAPHGTQDRLEDGNCYCPECVEAAIDSGSYEIDTRRVLVDLETGRPIPAAKAVSTRYGTRWVVESNEGTEWYPYGRKRRSTMADRGLLEADAPHLVRIGREYNWAVTALEPPEVDVWGEPIERADNPGDD